MNYLHKRATLNKIAQVKLAIKYVLRQRYMNKQADWWYSGPNGTGSRTTLGWLMGAPKTNPYNPVTPNKYSGQHINSKDSPESTQEYINGMENDNPLKDPFKIKYYDWHVAPGANGTPHPNNRMIPPPIIPPGLHRPPTWKPNNLSKQPKPTVDNSSIGVLTPAQQQELNSQNQPMWDGRFNTPEDAINAFTVPNIEGPHIGRYGYVYPKRKLETQPAQTTQAGYKGPLDKALENVQQFQQEHQNELRDEFRILQSETPYHEDPRTIVNRPEWWSNALNVGLPSLDDLGVYDTTPTPKYLNTQATAPTPVTDTGTDSFFDDIPRPRFSIGDVPEFRKPKNPSGTILLPRMKENVQAPIIYPIN